MTTKLCPVCAASFDCGANDDDRACWCASLPPVMPLGSDKGCQCPACLAQSIASRIEKVIADHDVNRMLDLAARFRDDGEPV